jgi:hypothetical protein
LNPCIRSIQVLGTPLLPICTIHSDRCINLGKRKKVVPIEQSIEQFW